MGQSESYEVSTRRYKDMGQEIMVCNQIEKTGFHFGALLENCEILLGELSTKAWFTLSI